MLRNTGTKEEEDDMSRSLLLLLNLLNMMDCISEEETKF
jgi:hypothetical protein